ncbi:hypothetical protein LTR62_005914 [Meristemomyces frigidus]|uniref:Microtubule associated protein n=1 Tax=Meristemomyces frigidus TaxID=1508187 RepID=A0AAN7TMW9_9PEZI|nr:hypothetical protein LTR62_005914 [Meristemomyces frigidus]
MALHTPNPNPNPFVRVMRKVYNPIGFSRGYNSLLFLIFAGVLLGFSLAKLPSLDVNGYWINNNAPGESYYFGPANYFYNSMIRLHLYTCIPAGILGVWQFLPLLRHNFLLLHRINGYLVILLLLVTNIGALGVARHAFGGSLATQGFVGVLAILTYTSIFLAYWNIKVLQIDQHRAWMLRLYVYLGTIITVRLINIVVAAVISRGSKYFTYYTAMECQKVACMAGGTDLFTSYYPSCLTNPKGLAIVRADLTSAANIAEIAASLAIPFAVSCWLALALHAFAVELYLHLTPAEGERLRQVSYERQLERGLEPAGSVGLVAERIGDAAAWVPLHERAKESDRLEGSSLERKFTSDLAAVSESEEARK